MGFFNKIKNGLSKTKEKIGGGLNKVFSNFRKVDEELLEELEETLIMSDFSIATVDRIIEDLRKKIKLKNIQDADQVKEELKTIIKNIFIENEPKIGTNDLEIYLIIGVNGVGKTTSIGKIANQYKKIGKKVVIAAADTFRAAAVEQLEVWSERAGAYIIKGRENEDPSSVTFKACTYAKENADVLIIDTAGRLHNKKNLMNELDKINRSIDKALNGVNYVRENLLVIDGTTGQNAVSQAKAFNEIIDINGIIVTKLDGSSKGGAIVSVVQDNKIPIKFIGVGEQIDDMEFFNSDDFVNAILDTEE